MVVEGNLCSSLSAAVSAVGVVELLDLDGEPVPRAGEFGEGAVLPWVGPVVCDLGWLEVDEGNQDPESRMPVSLESPAVCRRRAKFAAAAFPSSHL